MELVDVDEPTMQALLDAILAQDMADFGALIRGVLLRKGATPDDLLLLTLASLILNGDTEEIDVVGLADALRTIASFPLEESFSELEGLVGLIGTELEVSNELIASASRILENFIRYCLESWEAIDQEAGELFGENDDTFEYVLAWVTALYVQNFAELNEEETSMSKSGGAVSKQERQEREAAAKQLVTGAELNAVIESFNLDSLETYAIIDVDYVLGSLAKGEFNAAEYWEENLLFREAILAPIEAIATALEARIDEFAITKAVMRSASGTATRATGCPGCFEGGEGGFFGWLFNFLFGSSCVDGTIEKIECTAPAGAVSTNFKISNINRTAGLGNTRTVKAIHDGNPSNVRWSATANAEVSQKKGETTTITCSAGVSVVTAKLGSSEKQIVLNCFEAINPAWSGTVRNNDTVFRKSPSPTGGAYYSDDTKTLDAGSKVKNIRGYIVISGTKWYLCDEDKSSGGFIGYWVEASKLDNCWVTTPVTGAANLQAYLTANNLSLSTPSDSKITMSVSGNTVTMTTGFNYSGTLNNSTRRTLFESGISRWSGTHTMLGYSVTLNVVIDNTRVCSIKTKCTRCGILSKGDNK